MKKWLLEAVVCPRCHGPFEVETFTGTDDEVEEGLLWCQSCGSGYPVITAIPRLLVGRLAHELRVQHPEYYETYGDRLLSGDVNPTIEPYPKAIHTFRSFSYEWQTYSSIPECMEELFLLYTSPIVPHFFAGKIGLEAGCGSGRFVVEAARYAREVVALDFSESVEVAFANTKQYENVHILQADIYQLPFKENSFDFAYCFGVLHHLANPARAIAVLSECLKPGAPLLTWVYKKDTSFSIRSFYTLLRMIRPVTLRLPFPIVRRLSTALALPIYAMAHIPVVVSHKAFQHYGGKSLEYIALDWFDNLTVPILQQFSRSEVSSWFEQAGLRPVPSSDADWYGRTCGYKLARRP